MACGQGPWFTTYGRCACSVKVRKPAGWDATLDDVCVTADHLGQRYLAFGTASSVRTAEWESTPNSDKRQTMFWSAVLSSSDAYRRVTVDPPVECSWDGARGCFR